MERKDYLLEELSGGEKKYLKRIVMSARNRYIENNYMYINNNFEELKEDTTSVSKSVIDVVFDKYESEMKSAVEFEKLMTRLDLYNSVKALSLKEKMVLFCLYKENKTIRKTAGDISIDTKTVMSKRDEALRKILKQMIEEGIEDV